MFFRKIHVADGGHGMTQENILKTSAHFWKIFDWKLLLIGIIYSQILFLRNISGLEFMCSHIIFKFYLNWIYFSNFSLNWRVMIKIVRPCAQFSNKWIKKDIMNNDYVEDCYNADHDSFIYRCSLAEYSLWFFKTNIVTVIGSWLSGVRKGVTLAYISCTGTSNWYACKTCNESPLYIIYPLLEIQFGALKTIMFHQTWNISSNTRHHTNHSPIL